MRTRKIVKRVVGTLLILAGATLGLWLGVWVLFIGGIVMVVEAVKATPVDSIRLAIGILSVISASPVGWLTFVVLSIVGRICWL